MFFYISKILSFLVDPFVWIIAGLVFGVLKKINWIKYISLLLLIALSNPLLSNYAMSKWEPKPVKKETLPLFDVAIVLSGMIRTAQLPNDQVHFSDAADRLTEAINLYKEGIVQKILISGGSGSTIYNEIESELIHSLTLSCGISDRDIILEKNSRNTHENAKLSVQVLQKENLLNRKILLITSAFHIPRATDCFTKEGIDVVAFPVDFRAADGKFNLGMFVPTADSLSIWKILFSEWVGILVYKTLGYA
ncbi:MAG: YdcF family protein [Cyclobacteriaceae bacterium]